MNGGGGGGGADRERDSERGRESFDVSFTLYATSNIISEEDSGVGVGGGGRSGQSLESKK